MLTVTHGDFNEKIFLLCWTLSHDVELKFSFKKLTFQKDRCSRFVNTINNNSDFSYRQRNIT